MMCSIRLRMKQMIFVTLFAYGISQIHCPDVIQIGSSARLICTYPSSKTIQYLSPSGSRTAACHPVDDCNIQGGKRFNATNINSTHSSLRIDSVQLSDEGTWSCEDAFNDVKMDCSLNLTNSPSCNITSDRNTSDLHLHDDITLYVQTRDEHCTLPSTFHLRTGNKTMDLKKEENEIYSSNFNLADSYFGPVKLLFTCSSVTEEVLCENIQRLVKRDSSLDPTSENSANYDQDKTSIIAGTAAGLVLLIALIIGIWCVVKARCGRSNVSPGLRKTWSEDDEGGPETSEINGSIGSATFEEHWAGSEMITDVGYEFIRVTKKVVP